jgi:putative holliday junction resolvase
VTPELPGNHPRACQNRWVNSTARPGRVVALDLGSKRIGVATSDLTQTLATPYEVLLRRGSRVEDHKAIVKLVQECEAVRVVIGLPVGLNGKEGAAAKLIRDEVVHLTTALSVPVELFDERFTTTAAHTTLRAQNMRGEARRGVVDKVAAAVLLRAWLDAQALQNRSEVDDFEDLRSEPIDGSNDG